MSRSYRKVGGWKDQNTFMKKCANRRVRHKKDIPNGKAYRKYTCSYDICDWRDLYFSRESARTAHEIRFKQPPCWGWYIVQAYEPFEYKEWVAFGK